MFGNIGMLVTVLIFALILLILLKKIKQERLQKRNFESYSKFLCSTNSEDPLYFKKMTTIIDLVNNKKIRDLKKIARLSGCGYYESVLKIKVLKKLKAIENYYIDVQNGILNPCSEEDKKLIEKYDQFIYVKQLQPEEIAKSFPRTTLMNLDVSVARVLEELAYLDEKNLLNGVNIDLVDKKIIYYDIEYSKKGKDFISIVCNSCGAPNNVPRKGKARCEYCGRILEEDVKK